MIKINKFKKKLIRIVLFIIVILFAVFFYKSQQKILKNEAAKIYTNTKFGFSFQYPSTFSYSNGAKVMNSETDDSPLMFLEIGNNDSKYDFNVITIYKDHPKGYYDGRGYNPFTSNLNILLNTKSGETVKLEMGEKYSRLKDVLFGDKNTLVFSDDYSNIYYLIDSKKYYYVIFFSQSDIDQLAQVFNSFKFND